ncbi:MAG: hypothetical protein AAF683_01935 [Pseudomonadota bacterium]
MLRVLFQIAATAVAVIFSFVAASAILGSLSVRTADFATTAEIRPQETAFLETVSTIDGEFSVYCARANPIGEENSDSNWAKVTDPSWAIMRCQIRDNVAQRAISETIFGQEKFQAASYFRSCTESWRYFTASRLWPHARLSQAEAVNAGLPDHSDINLTSQELDDRRDSIGTIRPFCLAGTEVSTDLGFTLEAPSIQAVVGDAFARSLAIIDQEVSNATRERVAAIVVSVFEDNSGVFEVRKMFDEANQSGINGVRLLASGTFEYLILSFGITALVGSVLAVLLFRKYSSAGHAFGVLSARLGGLLTYMGLLGTLFGVFGAVQALSGIEFLNEFRKVFEQTASFGSMSLAIGTSVIGLGSAIVVGLVQSFLALVSGSDPFKE